jgi:hypothetical protein
MSVKIVKDGVMYLKNIFTNFLPDGFKTEYSLDCTDSDLTCLPDGLEVKGDLILGNAYIEDLPSNLTVGGNIIMLEKTLVVPSDAIIGGAIITSEGSFTPPLPEGHYIIADSGEVVIYSRMKKIAQENNVINDFYYPEVRFYKNIFPEGEFDAVQYTEDGNTYTLICKGIRDAKYQVDWHRAKRNGIDKYADYDIDEPRTVEELKEIYTTCTGACVSGINSFLTDMEIDVNKKYSIRETRKFVLHYAHARDKSKLVFLEYFDPSKKDIKEEAN